MIALYPNKDGIWVQGCFYATYGGGPEGGWFQYTCGDHTYLFRVDRSWGTPFVLDKHVSGYLVFHSDHNGEWVTYHDGDDTKSV